MDPKTFSHLLATNDPPDDLQAAVLRDERGNLTSRISELQLLLKALKDRLCQHRTILSPLRHVPLDVLGEIFKVTIPECMDKDGRAQLVDLSLVCRSWRDAAQGTHQLWSKITITGGIFPRLSYEKMVSWLGRSGSTPKILEMFNIETDHDVDTLVKLLTNDPSVDTFSMHFHGFVVFQRVLGQLVSHDKSSQMGCPNRSLNLDFSLRYHDEPQLLDRDSVAFFDLLPSTITSFRLHFLSRNRLNSCLFPPATFLNRLTSLSLSAGAGGSRLSTALTHCANLEMLTLHLDGYSSRELEESVPYDVVSLPTLHTLRLRQVSHAGFTIIVRLATPALTNLDIECEEQYEEDPLGNGERLAGVVKDLTERCPTMKSQLRSLRLCHLASPAMHISSFTNILRCVPSLTKLTLDGEMSFLHHDIVNGIRCHSRSLEVLEFLSESYGESPELVTVPGMLEFLATGERPGGLKKVVFEFADLATVESHPATQELRNAGVLVTFKASTM